MCVIVRLDNLLKIIFWVMNHFVVVYFSLVFLAISSFDDFFFFLDFGSVKPFLCLIVLN